MVCTKKNGVVKKYILKRKVSGQETRFKLARKGYNPINTGWSVNTVSGWSGNPSSASGEDNIVVVGSNNYVAYSADGDTWTTKKLTSGSSYSTNWYACTYTGSKYVALCSGSNKVKSTSTDGITWSTPSSMTGFTISAYGLAYNGSLLVALSSGTQCQTSTNEGSSWSTASAISSRSSNHYNLIYAQNKFITLSTDGYIATSTDGTTWDETQISNLSGHSWRGLSYDGNRFVAVSYTDGYITTSSDGLTWTNPVLVSAFVPGGTTYYLVNSCYHNGKLYAFGNASSLTYFSQQAITTKRYV